MENEKKEIENMCLTDFVEEYEKIVSTRGNSVVIKAEWNKKGDFFQKLTMYDNNYSPIKTLGNTTLIKAL